MDQTEVIYNGACPICAREIAGYRRLSEAGGLPIRYTDLNAADLARLGLSAEDAARRLHVVQEGRLIAGFPAFLALWSSMPRMRWLARLLGLPGLRTVIGAAYDRIAAPLLYALHRRRRNRALHKARPGG
ncbi:DUF393 domain-containing protein [Rhodovulum tesquicola]|uniref:thiol-disulfide oxidoreductase DCC family protein n=1 Tax=Rhodovulum tesquicola TaxID=540254 RepID=UPI002097D89E|nr:DUF393 domain-containing protein [Rhodovulum tesquicola]MCO8146313.1 DUF393 domain-containing protein [Rhodovulum tesquicola]